ncbi:MAG TPA: DUF1648 domain-containing protein [Candidatus Acidoferrales bacterium]|nr:DUF1648 domain-containing protein [Candidatus Acidoferrales bacterium]
MKARVLELAAGGMLIVAWLLAARAIATLPPLIPTHFGLDGRPDAHGSSATLWLLPAIMTAVYLLVSVNQFIPPRRLNLPVRITDRNRDGVMVLTRELLLAVKVCAMLTVLAVEWACIDASTRGALGPLFSVAIYAPVALLIGVIVYYTMRMRAV